MRSSLHADADETLLDPTAAAQVDDEDGDSHDAESSEGEDWADGTTLVSKFMDVDPEYVHRRMHSSVS